MVNRQSPDRHAANAPLIDVLIVAPESAESEAFELALEARGLVVARVHTSEGVARAVVGGRPDAVVVDLRPSGGVGSRLLGWVSRHAPIPTLVVTAPDDVDARLAALQLGAADHMIAPFATREGVARVERLVARRRAGRRQKLEAGDLVVDASQRWASRNSEAVTLTPHEAELLVALVERSGQTVSKQELLRIVWGGASRSENVVEANVSSLRRKLHAHGAPVIHTVHRGGYVFRPVLPSTTATRSALLAERDRVVRERDAIVARRDELIRRRLAERKGRPPS